MKRILAFILAVIMALSAAPCFAEETETEESGDMTFAKALGLIDSEADGEDTITRIELAEIFFNIISNNAFEAEYTYSDTFYDVMGEQAYIADFVASRGIMNGVGNGAFSPDSEVTYIELMKSFVSFLGYDRHAEAKGGYPTGYYNQAIALKIAQNNPADYNVSVTMNKVASVLKLALNTDLILPSLSGQELEFNNNTDYLGYYLEIFRNRGIVEANYLTNLSNNSKLDYDEVMQSGNLFRLGIAADGLRDMIGMTADIYYKEDNGELEAIYFEEGKNSVLTIGSDDVDSLSGRKLRYKKSGSSYANATLADDALVVYNGTVCASYDSSVLNPFKGTLKDGGIRLIDNNRDGEYDVIIIDAYDSYVVSYVDGRKIFNRYRQPDMVDITEYDEGLIEIVNILNEPLLPEDIKADDIINVSSDIDGNVRRIVVTIDSYIGVLNAVSADDEDGTFLTVDGMVYKVSAGFTSDFDISKLKSGNQIKVFFNKDALIAGIETDDYETYNIGYLASVLKDEFDDIYTLKIFCSDGKFAKYEVAEKVRLDNENRMLKAEEIFDPTADRNCGLISYDANNRVIRKPLLYRVDKETGKINWLRLHDETQIRPINYVSSKKLKENCLFMFEGFDGVSSRAGYAFRNAMQTFSGKLLISTSSVIFCVPDDANRNLEEEYYVESYRNVFKDGDTSTLFEAYGLNQRSPQIDIAVVKGERYGANSAADFDSSVILVEKTVTVEDEENGGAMKMIYGYSNRQPVALKADTETVKVCPNPDGSEKRTITRGDLIMVNTDQNNKVRNLELIFCAHENELQFASNPSLSEFTERKRFAYGTVIYKDDDFMTVRIEQKNGSYITESYPIKNFNFLEYERSNMNECRVSSADRIFDEYNYPGHASKVVVHTRSGEPRTITIYND